MWTIIIVHSSGWCGEWISDSLKLPFFNLPTCVAAENVCNFCDRNREKCYLRNCGRGKPISSRSEKQDLDSNATVGNDEMDVKDRCAGNGKNEWWTTREHCQFKLVTPKHRHPLSKCFDPNTFIAHLPSRCNKTLFKGKNAMVAIHLGGDVGSSKGPDWKLIVLAILTIWCLPKISKSSVNPLMPYNFFVIIQ